MTRSTIRTSFAALAMAIAAGALSTSALAAPEGAPAGPYKGGPHRGAPMERDGFWIPGLGPLSKAQVETLKLDSKQQALADEARKASVEMFKMHREGGRFELLDSQLKAGKLDPHALVADGDKRREQFETQEKPVREKWLAVWDSLNETQRTQVTDIVKQRMQKKQERHDNMQERHPGKSAKPASSN